jgi:hypothetical protein
MFYYDQTGHIPRHNLAFWRVQTASVAGKRCFWVPIRHPAVAEPIGIILGLPPPNLESRQSRNAVV